jgi:hypothetical protein
VFDEGTGPRVQTSTLNFCQILSGRLYADCLPVIFNEKISALAPMASLLNGPKQFFNHIIIKPFKKGGYHVNHQKKWKL